MKDTLTVPEINAKYSEVKRWRVSGSALFLVTDTFLSDSIIDDVESLGYSLKNVMARKDNELHSLFEKE